MTQSEKFDILVKKIAIMDDHIDYLKSLVERLEDRVIYLEDQLHSSYEEGRTVVFEDNWLKDDDDDDN